MTSIITFGMQRIFNLDKILHTKEKKESKKMFVPQKYSIWGKGLYSIIRVR